MRAFILLTALLGVASAKPQYGYQQPATSQSGLLSQQTGQQGGNKYLPPAQTTQAPIVHKQFYLVGAPEDNENEVKRKHLVLGRPQKNYRVVFIKAPAPDNSNVKYSAEFAPKEEKTVIYVLSKKGEDILSEEISTPAPTQPSKPEIFFIKYKTDEEADHAQKEIQSQYDNLGGTNEFDEGIAPITSVIGSLDGINPDGSYNYKKINNGGSAQDAQNILTPQTQYLPASFNI